jgi:hypothetical protein
MLSKAQQPSHRLPIIGYSIQNEAGCTGWNEEGDEGHTLVSEFGRVRARAHNSELRGGEESANTRFGCHP